MSERMPPDDDPIIRSLRDAGIRPLPPLGARPVEIHPRRARWILYALIVFLALFLVLPVVATRLSDWLWYREIGFERVFFTKIVAQWTLGLPAGLVAFAVLYASARIAAAGSTTRALATRMSDIYERSGITDVARSGLDRAVRYLSATIAVLVSLVFGLAIAAQWRTILQYWYRTPFGTVDPVFGRDVGYYIFTLPVIELVTGAAIWLIVLAMLAALPFHLSRAPGRRNRWRPVLGRRGEAQLAALAALLLIVMAVRIHFAGIPGLLFGEHLPLTGASYVDLHVRIPALHVLSVAALVGGALIVWGAARQRLVATAGRVVVGYLVVAVLAAAVPALVQRLAVQPNELAREMPQIVDHIRATRQAWGIDGVEPAELGTAMPLTAELVARNRATIDNVRLWDREPLLQTFGQIQSIRTYYDFVSVDDDRYRLGGQLRQVLLSPRELDTQSLPTRGFINEHLTYTHGMGLALGPSNAVTAEGLPVLFIKDLPPASSVDVRVTRPQIYYGELSNDFVLAPSRQREFDFPSGEGDAAVYSQYDGRGGVPVSSFLHRLLFAVRFGSLNILLSRDLTSATRILYYRDVRERARRALPFVLFDRDPYLVIGADGRLSWMLDAYTATDHYPYARGVAGGVNYMRNSVKVVIDAYDGSVAAYRVDDRDPMVRTIDRMYPGLLRPFASMPADLRAHVRYPEDLFRLQTQLYATYHMVNPETFYHREDEWQIPGGAGTAGPIGDPRRGEGEAFLRHMVMRLPGETEPEFILMRPFTPRQKDNLAAWMVARNDGAHYGELAVYRFPRQRLVFGPNQVVNRINQDTEVSRQVTLWDQRGSEVLRGELLVLPVEGSLIYVQPIYLRAQGGRIPELKRVVAVHEGRVSMGESLDDALSALYERGATAEPPALRLPETAVTGETAALLRQAREHYDRARAAQRADDWATYGEEMRRLGDVLRELDRQPPARP
ncbi:MAG: UPF0182 family protein [Gemmatimonadaceae bacterium]|nr:UPF0182 family protein [Gemmatimonadaceae bacterium]NUQ92497.1 UPF0182 family protein [Gemmatimonadaceae bacterium]NUR19963.1 UPF0182 family protein [Gemmatimonadaceae bacterium]NUS98772.1 UPF0182 family protein [Gemmatimonadaceae bacterium]